MALNLETVVKQLTDSGIIAPGKLEDFVPPKAAPKDGEALLRELHKQGLLTKFQAQQVAAGKARALLLGEYTILDKIGAGGMGQVFKAVHRRMDRTVAIKMLPPAMTKDAASMARFEREVRAAAKLSHPNIVAAYDAGQANNVHFLVMEYVEGNDLSALVKKDGPFPVAKAVNYILQAARGLEFAHGEGVVHRDIKPANLLLDKKSVVKILDMGLARIEGDGPAQTELTSTGTIMGTVDYMSPEQAMNTKNADHRADIYSLGISLYYLLAGKAAYGGDTAMEKLMAHQTQPIPSLKEAQKTVPKQLEAVFKKMVAKRVEDRYQSMTEVVAELEKYSADQPTGSATNWSAATKTNMAAAPRAAGKKSKLGRPAIVGLAATGALGMALALGLIFKPQSRTEAPAPTTLLPPGEGGRRPDEGARRPDEGGLAASAPSPRPSPIKGEGATAPNPLAASTSPPSPLVGEGSGAPGNAAWNTPAFQAWVKATQALPAEQQIEAVSKKLVELNPGFDGKLTGWDQKRTPTIEQGAVIKMGLITDHVTDISPVRALVGLKVLKCDGSAVGNGRLTNLSPLIGMTLTSLDCNLNPMLADLSPLHGMPLTTLRCYNTQVADLSPLRGMHLTTINLTATPVSELLPLQGMDLKDVAIAHTPVKAISSLKGMPIATLSCEHTNVSDLAPLEECTRLTSLLVKATKVTPTQVAALQKALPNCKIEWDGPSEATMPAGWTSLFNGRDLSEWTVKGDNGWSVKDGAVLGRTATPAGWLMSNAEYEDFEFELEYKLTPESNSGIFLRASPDGDLSGADFHEIQLLDDLAPKFVSLDGKQKNGGLFGRIAPTNAPRTPSDQWHKMGVQCFGTHVRVSINGVPVIDGQLPPGKPSRGRLGLQLYPTQVEFRNLRVRVLDAKGMPRVAAVGIKPWESPEFQKWVADTQKLPAEQQIEAVSKKLMELNPGFDGKVTDFDGKGVPKIKNGVVSYLGIVTDNVTDISPLRALGLKGLSCTGSAGGKGIFSDLSPLRGMQLTILTCWQNGVSDLSPLEGMQLAECTFVLTKVTDLSPLRGMPLTKLICSASAFSDLSPLKGLPLTYLQVNETRVSDLSPLKGMKLKYLDCYRTKVSDLSPLAGMPLTNVCCPETQVSDLAPLRGMPLTELSFGSTKVSDLSPLEGMNLSRVHVTPKNITKGMDVLRQMKSLQYVTTGAAGTSAIPAAEFWKKYDAGEFGMPAEVPSPQPSPSRGEGVRAWNTPAFQKWVKDTQALPAEKQIEAVSKKLMELNPGFDGKVTGLWGKGTPKIENGVVVLFGFRSLQVTDISPLRALPGLRAVGCGGIEGPNGQGKLSDLSPLQGMPLTSLDCCYTQIADLSPLEGMPLKLLACIGTKVSDLSPLRGMPLADLNCTITKVSSLSPLQGMPLTTLVFAYTQVSDLSPLKGMNLNFLGCWGAPVANLSPLEGMPLTRLLCSETKVSELAPLHNCKNLKHLIVTKTKVTPAQVAALQTALPNCKIEWDAATSSSPAGEGAKPKTPEPAPSGTK